MFLILTHVAKVEEEVRRLPVAGCRAQSQRSALDQNKMSDTMLMPPPPPRLPKRQKTASSLGDAAEATAAADEPTHPDLILIPPPPQRRSAAAGGGDDNEYFENSLSSGESTRSVSPKDFDNNGEKSINVSPAAREDSSGIRVATNEFGAGEISEGKAKSTTATQSHVEPSFGRTVNDEEASQSRDDPFGVNNENNQAMGGEDVFHDARLGNIPPQNNYELSTPHDSNEISATEPVGVDSMVRRRINNPGDVILLHPSMYRSEILLGTVRRSYDSTKRCCPWLCRPIWQTRF
mmetsp:Transcript_42130/g.77022  ORF Transcript_42130/g.77022 Transcript_42130/m.77022 type:complete len:292 (+) Transcript_42130:36-911(+)